MNFDVTSSQARRKMCQKISYPTPIAPHIRGHAPLMCSISNRLSSMAIGYEGDGTYILAWHTDSLQSYRLAHHFNTLTAAVIPARCCIDWKHGANSVGNRLCVTPQDVTSSHPLFYRDHYPGKPRQPARRRDCTLSFRIAYSEHPSGEAHLCC